MDEKMSRMDKRGKKGQVTIWIILAIVLVASIILFFSLARGPRLVVPPESSSVFDLQTFFDACVSEHVSKAVDIMLPHGGFISPKNSKFFDNTNIEYLCDNIGYYKTCVNQHPMLLNEMKEEIRGYIEPKIRECFSEIEEEIEDRKGEIVFGPGQGKIGVEFGPDKVFVKIEQKASVTKNDETRNFDSFNVEVDNPIYDIGSVAVEITAQEAKYCYFEYIGYKVLYPRFTVTKYTTSDSTKIYTIEYTRSGKKMNIAIRSCVIPAGF